MPPALHMARVPARYSAPGAFRQQVHPTFKEDSKTEDALMHTKLHIPSLYLTAYSPTRGGAEVVGDLWMILLTVELINSDEESKLSYVCCLPPETTAVLER